MFFSEAQLSQLRENPLDGVVQITSAIEEFIELNNSDWDGEHYDALLEAYALIVELVEAKLLDIPRPNIPITGRLNNDCHAIWQFLNDLRTACFSQTSKLKVESMRKHFRSALGNGFSYEFSKGDLDSVQALLNELRELIAHTDGLEIEHRLRLLNRLEKLQAELHKKVSDLDRFWGLVGDAGVVLGKLGESAKPIVDRIREIADIVWRTQSRAEELPSGTRFPLLQNRDGAQQ